MAIELGKQMFFTTLSVRGRIDEAGAARIADLVVKWIGMTSWVKGRKLTSAYWQFPLDGAGGIGLTYIQPLVESFIGIDTWDDHDGFYISINSCRHFHLGRLVKRLNRHGWTVLEQPYLYSTTLYPNKSSWWRRLLRWCSINE